MRASARHVVVEGVILKAVVVNEAHAAGMRIYLRHRVAAPQNKMTASAADSCASTLSSFGRNAVL